MEEGLELKRLITLVLDVQLCFQLALAQGDAVDEAKGVGPFGFDLVSEKVTAQAEIQLDTVVGLAAQAFTAALSQELPKAVPGETMLGQFASGVGLGRRAKDREDQRDAASDGFGAVESRSG